ncbi:hypothetical protein FN846DRAFT_906514 [Sphaerosporella brunnea]|uniref:Uncharacterized protein n=1 Tax=Sphaerosporella brunnea TaxID=1250544 RepID=A0A5J5EZP8_9PEZI|nr:hypothetical protein FN846DRAFT_906514 [Sphaerosporella brunnea]
MAQAPSLNVAPISFVAGGNSFKPRKQRRRPRKQAAPEISASAGGRLVDSSQVAAIAAAQTANVASSTVANGLRRSGRTTRFTAKHGKFVMIRRVVSLQEKGVTYAIADLLAARR